MLTSRVADTTCLPTVARQRSVWVPAVGFQRGKELRIASLPAPISALASPRRTLSTKRSAWTPCRSVVPVFCSRTDTVTSAPAVGMGGFSRMSAVVMARLPANAPRPIRPATPPAPQPRPTGPTSMGLIVVAVRAPLVTTTRKLWRPIFDFQVWNPFASTTRAIGRSTVVSPSLSKSTNASTFTLFAAVLSELKRRTVRPTSLPTGTGNGSSIRLFGVTPKRDAPRAAPRAAKMDRVWIPRNGAPVPRARSGVMRRVCGWVIARMGVPPPAGWPPVPVPEMANVRVAVGAAPPTTISSFAVDVRTLNIGPRPVSSIRTGNVPARGGVHSANVTVRRSNRLSVPRSLVAICLPSILSVALTRVKSWLNGFEIEKASDMGLRPPAAIIGLLVLPIGVPPPVEPPSVWVPVPVPVHRRGVPPEVPPPPVISAVGAFADIMTVGGVMDRMVLIWTNPGAVLVVIDPFTPPSVPGSRATPKSPRTPPNFPPKPPFPPPPPPAGATEMSLAVDWLSFGSASLSQ